LAAALAAGAALHAAPNDEAREAFAEAQAHLKANDLRAAKVLLMNAVKADPGYAEALILQAKVALDLFDPLTAQSALERAKAAGVPKARIAHLLGAMHWMQGDLNKAEAVLAEPNIPTANRSYASRIVARVKMDRGDFAAAQAIFASALAIAPQDSQLWTDMARLRFVTADQKGAIDAVDHALKLDPNNVRALEFRGVLMRSQFGMVAALPWFERGLQIAPTDVPLLEEYGATLGEAGRYRDMLKVARQIIALDSRNPRAFYMQAVLAARAGNYELAKRILPRAGSDFGEMPAAMLLDAICEYELGNYNRAVDQYQRLLAMQPRNRKVRTLLAQALYRASNPLDALDVIREIAGRGDADSYSLTTAARAFEASDQRDRSSAALDDAALSVLRPALPLPEPMSLAGAADEARRNPNNARAVIPYIRLLLAEGNIDAAYAEATRLQAGNAGVADAHILMGDIEIARGNVAGAVTAYGQARAISFTEPVMLRLADALSRSGDEKAAGETLAAYLAYNPQSLTALRLAGYRNLDAGEWANAIALLERVRARLGYNDSILLANLARAYSGAGKHDAAVRDAAIAYRIAPANLMVTRTYSEVLRKSGKRPKAARELAAKVRAFSRN
jgi:cellulose synthase operon protein C